MTLTRVFLPFAFGYFLSYLFRVVNAVLGLIWWIAFKTPFKKRRLG